MIVLKTRSGRRIFVIANCLFSQDQTFSLSSIPPYFKDQDPSLPSHLWGHVCMKLLSRHSKRFVPWINLSYVYFHPLQKPGSAIQVCVHQFSAPWLLSSPLLFFCLYFVWRPSQTCLWIIIWANYTSSSLEFWDIFGMLIFIWDTSHFHAIQFCLAPFSDLPLVYRLSKVEWQGHLLYEPPKKSMKAKFILVWPPKRLWKPSLSWFGH